MYRALYDYKTNLARYLSFQAGDEFTVVEYANQDWFLAQNGFGEIGYIPKNYMLKETVSILQQQTSESQYSHQCK